jgi:hypothetical protein
MLNSPSSIFKKNSTFGNSKINSEEVSNSLNKVALALSLFEFCDLFEKRNIFDLYLDEIYLYRENL